LRDAVRRTNPIDTIRLDIRAPLHPEDSTTLDGTEWNKRTERRTDESRDHGLTEKVWCRWTRKTDDLRVLQYETRTAVEVSLPKFFGLSNHEMSSVPKGAAPELIRVLQDQLLPNTTSSAREGWTVRRMDLAIDFKGNIRMLVNLYSLVRFPFARKPPSMKSDTGLVWESGGRRLSLYGKSEEVKSRTGSDSTLEPDVCRLELRLNGVAGLTYLLPFLGEVGGTRLAVATSVHPSGGLFAHLSNPVLHTALADTIAGLQPPEVNLPVLKTIAQHGLHAIANDPWRRAVVRGHSSPRSARRYLKDSAALQVSQANADLLDLAYGVPATKWVDAWPAKN